MKNVGLGRKVKKNGFLVYFLSEFTNKSLDEVKISI